MITSGQFQNHYIVIDNVITRLLLTIFKVICISALFCSINNVCVFILTNENVQLHFTLTKIANSTTFEHRAYNFKPDFRTFQLFFPDNLKFWYSCQIMRMGRVRFVVCHTRTVWNAFWALFWKFLHLLYMYYAYTRLCTFTITTVRNWFAGNFTQKGLWGRGILFANVPFCTEILSWFFETAGPPLPDNGPSD
jgi:hypothetical protein